MVDVTQRMSSSDCHVKDASKLGLTTQKRRKNGISSRTVVLALIETPPSKSQVMEIWHPSMLDLTMSRRSVVPLSSGPKTEEASTNSLDEAFCSAAP